MLIIRRYKALGWFDLLDKLEEELSKDPPKERYFDFLDEFRMRLIESVSEGASYKLRNPTLALIERFQQRQAEDPVFASETDRLEFQELASQIIK